MPVEHLWLDDQKSILCYRFIHHWTWDELWSAVYEARDEYRHFDHTVDILADMTESDMIPGEALTQLRKLTATRTDNLGIIVIASSNVIVSTIINMGRPLLPISLKFELVNTRDEGIAYIRNMRQTA